jgi:hypothetical protein
VGPVIPDDYHDFFVAAVGAAGALVGLLFVAISVSPHREAQERLTYFEVEASSALIAFTHVLIVSLLSLLPGINIGYAAVSLAGIEVAYSLAATRLIHRNSARSIYGVPLGLTVIAGFSLWGGIRLLLHPGRPGGLDTIAAIVVVSLVFGISRSWQLVGLRDTGLISSLRVVLRADPNVSSRDTGPERSSR